MGVKLQQAGIINPLGLDRAISDINTLLEGVSWISHIYTRSFALQETVSNRERSFPKAYFESGEYLKTLPNDNFTGMSFFMATGAERYIGDNFSNANYQHTRERDLALFFWVNLKAIDPAKDYIFTEELKIDIENVLSKAENVRINSYLDEDYRQIFSGLFISDKTFMMYPYAAFRFNITVNYYGKRNC